MAYVPLHVHSICSGPEGMMGLRELVSRASFLGLGALALTDHRSTLGHFEFFAAAHAASIKPVLGAEIQHAPLVAGQGPYHLTLLAENEEGYRNLCEIVSRHSSRDREPRVSVEDLESHAAGLIALTGCLKGEVSQSILHGNLGRTRDVILRLAAIFGPSNVFMEIMNHGRSEEALVCDQLRVLSVKMNVPLVATNNDRYLQREDAEYYRIARLIHRKKTEGEEEPFQEYYLKRERDLLPLFAEEGDAVGRSGEIAERCKVDLARSGRISFSVAPNAHDALVDMCRRRFLLAFHTRRADERSRLKRAMERELDVAREEGLSDFLIFLRNLFTTAVENGIWLELVGSDLLESMVSYLLEIIPLNPTDHDLVFESFSPSKRGSMPPIDLIVSEESKKSFVEMIRELLPGLTIRFQVTQEEMSAATIAKEVADSLNAPHELREDISRILAFEKRHRSLAALLESSTAAQRIYNDEPLAKSILHAAFALQGKIHHLTLDSSKLVVLPAEIEGLHSVVEGPTGERFAQLGAAAIEEIGGWVVGVQHSHFLSALERTIDGVQKERDVARALRLFRGSDRIRWTPSALDDPHVFALISSGDTEGVYMLESQGMREHLKRIKPETFDELVNVISLYRPGPLDGRLWEKYLENGEKKGKVYLPHHSLAPLLAGTRGVLLYREQVREILQEIAGLRGEEAVVLERAFRSKDSGELQAARLKFMRSAMDAGLNEEDAQKVFDFLLHNIAFTYSKALSCIQASLSYRTAYLKAHLFERYFTELLNSNLDVKERRLRYVEYLKSRKISVLAPAMNTGLESYSYLDGKIRAPLASVAGLDRSELDAIREERARGGDFASPDDFFTRLTGRLSAKSAEAIIEAGMFDDTGIPREALVALARPQQDVESGSEPPHPTAARSSEPKRKKGSERQTSLFDEP
ncbi:MAG: DNA polymerase III subunit alpha [Candidatus Krumholzibacteria bacterium]|nr:DNA polymerase III subunit alpha [Candidatus Krumholzibacteria bacterium]